MDLIGAIAGYSTAAQLAEVQMAVAAKVLKLAQSAQATPAVELLQAASEQLQDSIEAMAGSLGDGFDVYA